MKTICNLIVAITLFGLLSTQAKDSDKTAMSKTLPAKKSEPGTKDAPSTPPVKILLTSTQQDKLLALLNQGSEDDLKAINGIAATRAESIINARPFKNVHDIILVPGVGNATFERIMEHGKALTQAGAKSGKS